MEDYKLDIEKTRFGCLGSSDAAMLARIAVTGSVPKSAWRRLAVVKGLAENKNIPYSDAVRTGDEIEQAVFAMLKSQDERYVSNPCWTSVKYSRKNVRGIDHPDIVLEDEEKKIINVYEVKASRYPTAYVRAEYAAQLYYHKLYAEEIAARYGRGWKARVYLVHYNTDGLDLSRDNEFDTARLSVTQVRQGSIVFNLPYAMDVVNEFLEGFTEYYEGDEVDSEYLPQNVKEQFDAITRTLAEIKEREEKVSAFKERLFAFMKDRDIKSIKNAAWSITRVDENTSRSFDGKRFFEDYKAQHPVKAKKLLAQYEKIVNRKGSVQIRIKNDNG